MRDLQGSLTKELKLETIERTISLAHNGMSYADFRAAAAQVTHGDAPGLVAKRFLSVVEGRIVRDHFLSLVENEGLGTQRMRKVMYGVWILRDSRFRRFVLEKIAAPQGTWRAAEITKKSNATFFSDSLGFQKNSAPKIRSNFEYFLVETGVFRAASRTVHLDLADHWLDDAVRAASELEDNTAQRLEMMADPLGWVVRHQFHGLANVTSESLTAIPSAPAAESEAVLDLEIPAVTATVGQSKQWQKRDLVFASKAAKSIALNPVARERASRAHYEMEKLLADLVEARGGKPQFNDNIDLFYSMDAGSVVVEVKSCHNGNFHAQVRRGVAQLLEYAFRYRNAVSSPIQLVLLVETEPPTERRWLIDFLAELKIVLVWKANDNLSLSTFSELPASLSDLVTRVPLQ